jgi:hypothetical protein
MACILPLNAMAAVGFECSARLAHNLARIRGVEFATERHKADWAISFLLTC